MMQPKRKAMNMTYVLLDGENRKGLSSGISEIRMGLCGDKMEI